MVCGPGFTSESMPSCPHHTRLGFLTVTPTRWYLFLETETGTPNKSKPVEMLMDDGRCCGYEERSRREEGNEKKGKHQRS